MLKPQFVTCLLIFAAFLAVGCSGSPSPSDSETESTTPAAGNRLFTEMRLGYSIRYPETWYVTKPAPFVVQFLSPQEETGFFVAPLTSPIILPGQPLPKDRENIGVRGEVENIEEAADAFVGSFTSSFIEFEVVSKQPAEGLRGQLVKVVGKSEDATVNATVLVAEGGRELLAAVGVIDRDNGGDQSIVDAMIESFTPFTESPPDDHNDTTDNASVLEIGGASNGTIGWYDDVDVFSFQAETGKSYEASVELINLDDSLLSLLSSMDCVVSQNDDRDEEDKSSRVSWRAKNDVVYYLAVTSSYNVRSGRGEDRSIGDYTLTIKPTNEAHTDDFGNHLCSAATIEPGDSIDGVLENSTDEDYFTFKAEAGKHYSFDFELNGLERAFFTLRGSNGGPLTSYSAPFDSGSGIEWTAPQTFFPQAFVDDPSIYYLSVGHLGSQQGVERSGGYKITASVK